VKNSLLPNKTIIILLAVWFFLFIFFGWVSYNKFYLDPPIIYPISIVYKSTATINSMLPLILLIILVVFALKYSPKNAFILFFLCLALIVLGNLLQGGIYEGFVKPIGGWQGMDYEQPFHDVVKIHSGFRFLKEFDIYQSSYSNHTQTHPPFLVLFYYCLYQIGGIPIALTISILIISTIFPLFYFTMLYLGFSKSRAVKFTILLALIPTINIYSIITWDALAAIGYMIFLMGMVLIYRCGLRVINFIILLFGFVFANMLNYLAIGLLVIIGIVGFWQFLVLKRKDLLFATGGILFCFLIILILWKFGFNYDHLLSFLKSSQIELGKTSHHLSTQTIKWYILSRIEDIGEILLFLSFGVIAVCFTPLYRRFAPNLKSFENALLFSASTIILLFLIFGVFRTGETARPFIWLIPYVLISLKNIEDRTLNALIGVVTVQTISMQLAANYFW
jgi:hypothetical protein